MSFESLLRLRLTGLRAFLVAAVLAIGPLLGAVHGVSHITGHEETERHPESPPPHHAACDLCVLSVTADTGAGVAVQEFAARPGRGVEVAASVHVSIACAPPAPRSRGPPTV